MRVLQGPTLPGLSTKSSSFRHRNISYSYILVCFIIPDRPINVQSPTVVVRIYRCSSMITGWVRDNSYWSIFSQDVGRNVIHHFQKRITSMIAFGYLKKQQLKVSTDQPEPEEKHKFQIAPAVAYRLQLYLTKIKISICRCSYTTVCGIHFHGCVEKISSFCHNEIVQTKTWLSQTTALRICMYVTLWAFNITRN